MLKVVNPATEEVLAELPEESAVGKRFLRARAAQPGWAATPLEERAAVVRKFRALLLERQEELARTLTREVGKPIAQSRREVDGTLARIDFFLEAVPRVLREEQVHAEPGLEERIALEPLGVVANISAWNYPYYVGSNVFLPALLAGNAVLYKPSEFASLTGLAIGKLWEEAGLPPGVFQVLVGGGAVGRALLEQPVGGVFFTGSYATGKRIAEAAGPRMVRLQLEMGGKDPVYVCDDVDLRAAAEATADGAFYNAGQSCCAVERLYVHRRIYEPFLEAFVEGVRSFKVGDPMDPGTYLGPVTRPTQLDVLSRQVADARAKGARLLLGGRRMERQGFYFEPTVLADATHEMAVMKEESFGPLIGLMPVEDDDAAARWMQDTEYGLTAGVYTRDRARAERILARLDVGSAYWNSCDRVSPRLPWSGRRHSGVGVTLSTYGVLAFLQPKAWHLRSPKS